MVVWARPEGAEFHFLPIAKPPKSKLVRGVSESSWGTLCQAQAQAQSIGVVQKEAPYPLTLSIWSMVSGRGMPKLSGRNKVRMAVRMVRLPMRM